MDDEEILDLADLGIPGSLKLRWFDVYVNRAYCQSVYRYSYIDGATLRLGDLSFRLEPADIDTMMGDGYCQRLEKQRAESLVYEGVA